MDELEAVRDGRKRLEAARVKDPGIQHLIVERVPFEDIRVADLSFQFRFSCPEKDLFSSLHQEGQREPVDLVGETPPYRIADGFRRTAAARSPGPRQIYCPWREQWLGSSAPDRPRAPGLPPATERRWLGHIRSAG